MTSALGINENNQWYTPAKWIIKVNDVFEGSIDLDPASCKIANERVMAKNIFTIENSGLKNDWFGKVFCNPPYSAPDLTNFLKKAIKEFESGHVSEMIILTNQGTDTRWCQIISKGLQAYTIGRISFVRPNGFDYGGTSRGQLFSYYGPNKEKFIKVFTENNDCWIPNYRHLDLLKL